MHVFYLSSCLSLLALLRGEQEVRCACVSLCSPSDLLAMLRVCVFNVSSCMCVHSFFSWASAAMFALRRDASEAAMRRQILEKEAQVLRRASLQALDALKARVEETLHSA